jgi:putative phosphoesterase
LAGILGVISDTHGLLRPEAVDALRGSSLIIHAGDIGTPEILAQLRNIAPVKAVRGNVDTGTWAAALPKSLLIDFESHAIHVRHVLDDPMPIPAAVGAVIYGHSHKPSIEDRGRVLYLNPGSAGPRRFRLPVTVARMSVVEGALTAQIVELFVRP